MDYEFETIDDRELALVCLHEAAHAIAVKALGYVPGGCFVRRFVDEDERVMGSTTVPSAQMSTHESAVVTAAGLVVDYFDDEDKDAVDPYEQWEEGDNYSSTSDIATLRRGTYDAFDAAVTDAWDICVEHEGDRRILAAYLFHISNRLSRGDLASLFAMMDRLKNPRPSTEFDHVCAKAAAGGVVARALSLPVGPVWVSAGSPARSSTLVDLRGASWSERAAIHAAQDIAIAEADGVSTEFLLAQWIAAEGETLPELPDAYDGVVTTAADYKLACMEARALLDENREEWRVLTAHLKQHREMDGSEIDALLGADEAAA